MIEVSQKQNIIIQSLIWHYFDMPKNILRAWRNFLLFNLNYFSITLLLKTFFSPWRRDSWSYPKGFDIGQYLEVFFSNLISRVLGAIVRSVLIILGIIIELFIILGGIIVFFGWLVLPVILFFSLIFGFKILT